MLHKSNLIRPRNQKKKSENEQNYWREFIKNSSVHGVQYFDNDDNNFTEKFLWRILVFVAVISGAYVSFLVSKKFRSSPLATVFENTSIPVSDIDFPAMTICSHTRVNFSRTEEAMKKFAPKLNGSEKVIFEKLLISVHKAVYGNFEGFSILNGLNLTMVNHINLTELQIFVAPDCDKFFVKCMWLNSLINCCDVFSLELGQYGVCYAFNSYLSFGNSKIDKQSKDFPWRSDRASEAGGLKVWVNALKDIATNTSGRPGIYVIFHENSENVAPEHAKFLPPNTQNCFIFDPCIYTTSDDVEKIHYIERQCIFLDEIKKYGIRSIDQLPYAEDNCIVKCIQEHMLKYCGCSVDWMIHIEGQVICNASDLLCIHEKEVIFNNIEMIEENPNTDNKSVSCNCFPECNRLQYGNYMESCYHEEEVGHENDSHNIIQINVHYRNAKILKYRTDLVFGTLDLIVSLGGIAGLFLGCSLLSFVELIFFLFAEILNRWKKSKTDSKAKVFKKVGSRDKIKYKMRN